MAKSKWFRVAVEGQTATDRRTIEKAWLTDIAATYNRATYGARVNMEHMRGFSPQPPFNAYGDVLAARVQLDDIEIGGKVEKRTCLYCQVEPTDALVTITKDKQKIYTSIEVDPNFAGTGKAGLVGLAVTDSPASLGTDILQFSAGDDPAAKSLKAMLDARKQTATNVFSAAHETTFALEPEEAPQPTIKDALKDFFTDLLKPEAKDPPKIEPPAAPPATSGTADFARLLEGALGKFGEAIDARFSAFDAKYSGLRSDHDALKTSLDGAPAADPQRPRATGARHAYTATDC